MLLCKDSNTSEWIYIVKTGSCRVLKDLIETRPNIPGLEFIDYSAFDTTVSKYNFVLQSHKLYFDVALTSLLSNGDSVAVHI